MEQDQQKYPKIRKSKSLDICRKSISKFTRHSQNGVCDYYSTKEIKVFMRLRAGLSYTRYI